MSGTMLWETSRQSRPAPARTLTGLVVASHHATPYLWGGQVHRVPDPAASTALLGTPRWPLSRQALEVPELSPSRCIPRFTHNSITDGLASAVDATRRPSSRGVPASVPQAP